MSKDPEQHDSYQFGDFTLDTGRGVLCQDDQEIRLRPQSFEILAYLVANHGRLITKEELLEEVWRGRAVTDDSLTQCLVDIRKALGDTEREVVRTVPRRGYVFETKVTDSRQKTDVVNGRATLDAGKWRLIAASAAVFIAILIVVMIVEKEPAKQPIIENSIAVLPFIDMSQASEEQYLGDGLAEDILNALAQNPNLRVIARTSSFSFNAQSPDISTIRESLNVAYVLAGSVRRTGDFLRISAELSDTSDSTLVWSQPLETQQSDLASIQQYIAERVQSAILPESEVVLIEPPVRNFSANEYMWLGRNYERQVYDRPEVDEEILQKAIDHYRLAMEAEPGDALAHARLARMLLFAGQLNEAEALVNRSLILNANLSEVQETKGLLYWTLNLPDAETAWLRAIELNPNNADAISSYAYWYWIRVDQDKPAEYFRTALELDPLSLARYADLGNFLGQEARISEVENIVDEIRGKFDTADSYRVIANLLDLIGRTDESIAWTIRAVNLEPDNNFHVSQLAEYYVDIGDFDTAVRLDPDPLGILIKLRRYADFIDKGAFAVIDAPNDVYLHYLLAFAYNVTGQSRLAAGNFERLGVKGDWTNARTMYDIEAALMLADATYGAGDTERAQEIATAWLRERHTKSTNWWVHVYSACALSILDRDDESLDELDMVRSSPRLPWKHLIQDMVCFRKFEGEPRYESLLAHVDQRLAAVRENLPQTLAEFGVSL
jgi:TolB-like protein/DNA-binding winged helix-turn-helix (wHTH) protein/tetratricopeptide (TPR) repeat protein